jgi:hypothetical protein
MLSCVPASCFSMTWLYHWRSGPTRLFIQKKGLTCPMIYLLSRRCCAFAQVAILSHFELNAPSECPLLVHQSRHTCICWMLILTLVDTHDMDMRNSCRCFSWRSQSSSQEMTCDHMTWGWTRFLASPWFFKDAWTKSGGSIEVCRESLLLLRFWQLNRPMLGLIVLMTIEHQKDDKFWGWCYWCVE